LILSCVALLTRKLQWSREAFYLTIPPAFYLLVAMTSSLNIGIRHMLPIYVFLAVLAAGASLRLIQSSRQWGYVVAVLLVLHIASSLKNYPDYIAYANEAVGGPSATYKYLSDSNTDWGQQLKSVKKYLDRRGVKECWFAYFVATAIRPSDYGIPCKILPTAETGWFGADLDVPPTIHGPVLLSAGSMSGFELGSSVLNPYTQFEKMQPTAAIEHGVLVFDGTFQVPLASAMCHAHRSSTLREAKKLPEALAEAQTAVSIDPDALQAQMALGEALAANKQTEAAREAFQKALLIAQTMEPSAQMVWLPRIQHIINNLQK
jgi:tetratricopeptide (TPR) repeat protein